MSQEQNFIIELAWIMFLIVSVLTAGGTVIGCVAFYKANRGTAKSFTYLMSRSGITQLVVAAMIVVVAVVLNVIGRIGPEAVVSILSSIAAYILGNASAARSKTNLRMPAMNSNNRLHKKMRTAAKGVTNLDVR
ncbi:MAG TPA: hypothetical protein VEH84_04870 [Alphaproteobacteria bacterium]|nr:hypothetical protein [Alphaproteobacteria bacterium]